MTSEREELHNGIHREVHLPHPPAVVWRALTDPERMAKWLMPNTFKLEIGHHFILQGEAVPAVRFDGVVECEVLDYEPERMLRFSWRDPGKDNGLDSVVTWWLRPTRTGTDLVLQHEGFDPDNWLQQMSRQFMSNGWVAVLNRLAAVIDGG